VFSAEIELEVGAENFMIFGAGLLGFSIENSFNSLLSFCSLLYADFAPIVTWAGLSGFLRPNRIPAEVRESGKV
jgi:hypothetical protein